MTAALCMLTLGLLTSTAATRNDAGSRSCSGSGGSTCCAEAWPEFGVLGADAGKCALGAQPDWLLPGPGSAAAPRHTQDSGPARHCGLCIYCIENDDSKLVEQSTVDSAADSSAVDGQLDDFAAFTPDDKPDLITDKSRTPTCCIGTCIGGEGVETWEVTEEAASRKVNVCPSRQKAVCYQPPKQAAWPDNVFTFLTCAIHTCFTGGFS